MYRDPYIVLGTGRSGTSALAGMMFYLGFYMGDKFVPADKNNPAGHWEDKMFKNLNLNYIKDYISEDEFLDKIETRINMRGTEHKFWGFKVPSTAQVIDKYKEVCNPNLIWCKRPKEDVVNSMMEHYGWKEEQAEYLHDERIKMIEKHFNKKKDLKLTFKDIIEKPEDTVEKIIDYTGITPLESEKERAISHITKNKPPETDDTKVLVAVHNGGSIRREVAHQCLRMVVDGRYQVTIAFPQAKPYTKNVNRTIQNSFLPDGYDFLLILDSDNPPMKNPLDLIELNKDIIGLPTPQWSGEIIYPVAMDKVPNKQFKSLPPEKHQGIQEVDAHGSGCILIARRVIEAVDQDDNGPVWNDIWQKKGTERTTADYNFCDRAKEKGFKVWAHFDYHCEHIKELSLQDILNYANRKPKGRNSQYWNK
ncbi:MAG: hypothetical protein ACOCTT_02865 [archaeon]